MTPQTKERLREKHRTRATDSDPDKQLLVLYTELITVEVVCVTAWQLREAQHESYGNLAPFVSPPQPTHSYQCFNNFGRLGKTYELQLCVCFYNVLKYLNHTVTKKFSAEHH